MSDEPVPEVKSVDDKVTQLERVQEKLLTTMQGMVSTINELRQKSENTQVIMSSVLRTIADGRPLDRDQLRESHHLITAEKVNNIFHNAVKVGMIEPIEAINDDSIVVVQEFDVNGLETHRASEFSMTNVDEEFKGSFRGKTVGDRVPLFKDGQLQNTFVIQSIYKPLDMAEKELNVETK